MEVKLSIQSVLPMTADSKAIEICIVEDEVDLREELTEALREAGFAVRGFTASRELYAALLATPCSIVILDIGLPGEDGFSIAARLRSLGKIGIIMLSARTDVEDRVRSLQGGADVYLTKPVDLRELLAVITSLARRLATPKNEKIPTAVVSTGCWALSVDGWTVIAPNAASLTLTAQERSFLMRLWKCPGMAVSREDLAIALDGDPYEYDLHRLDTLVSRLRRKAASINLTLPLRSVRGKGYVIVPTSK